MPDFTVKNMAKLEINEKREVVPGLTKADVKEMADKIFKRTDGNDP